MLTLLTKCKLYAILKKENLLHVIEFPRIFELDRGAENPSSWHRTIIDEGQEEHIILSKMLGFHIIQIFICSGYHTRHTVNINTFTPAK